MQATYLIEPHKTAASVLLDKQASIELWAEGLLTQTLDKEPTFLAYLKLGDFGPKNDWNGQRSAARRLFDEITAQVQLPACKLYRELYHAQGRESLGIPAR